MTPFEHAGATITNFPTFGRLQTYGCTSADCEIDNEVYAEVRCGILRKLEDWLYSYDTD